jgi:hypothetical protein
MSRHLKNKDKLMMLFYIGMVRFFNLCGVLWFVAAFWYSVMSRKVGFYCGVTFFEYIFILLWSSVCGVLWLDDVILWVLRYIKTFLVFGDDSKSWIINFVLHILVETLPFCGVRLFFVDTFLLSLYYLSVSRHVSCRHWVFKCQSTRSLSSLGI